MEIYLTRHGQSVWQITRDDNFDTRLTPMGERQAEHLAAWLSSNPEGLAIAGVHYSPLMRARQTARPLVEALDVPSAVNDDLAEADFWIAPVLPSTPHPGIPVTGWEPTAAYQAFKQRASRALDRLVAAAERGSPVLAVAHGGLIATILRLMVDSDHVAFWSHNTGLHKVEWSRGRWQIMYLNRLEHLPFELRTF